MNYKDTTKDQWSANDYADFYRYEWGINVVPSNGCQLFKGDKVPPEHTPEAWREWTDKPIPLELHEKWKEGKKFDQGLMRVTGPVWHKEELKNYKYCSVDSDNSLAMTEFMVNGPIENSEKHVIEMHLGTSSKCHWEFYIKKDAILTGKASDARNPELEDKFTNNKAPNFEVKIGNGVMFGAPSMHPDGTKYEFLGKNIPVLIDGDKLQLKIKSICKKYNLISGDGEIKVKDLVQSGVIIQEGQDRSGGVLRFVDSLCRRLSPLYLPEDYFVNAAFWFYKTHAAPGYTDEKIRETAIQAVKWVSNQIQEENNTKYQKIISGRLEDGLSGDCYWLVLYMIKNLKIINKAKIHTTLTNWFLKVAKTAMDLKNDELYDNVGLVDGSSMFKDVIKSVFNNEDVISSLKELAREYGRLKERITVSKDQHMEAAIYLMERYHVRKHGLDGKLIYFNDIHYDRSSEAFLMREAMHMMIRTKKSDLKEVLNYIENDSQLITLFEMTQHTHIICLLNGTYNIKTGEFSTIFSPDYYIFDQIPYNYDNMKPFDTIKNFVNEMIPDEKDRQFYFDFGSTCFHPYNGIYFQLGLVGPPGTGKTQLCKLNSKLFNEDTMVFDPTIQAIADDATTRKDTALGRLIVDGDMHDTGIKTVSNLKREISQENFTDRSVYEHSGKYRPSSRIMFSANSLYEISNKDDASAIYDRTKLIKFNKKIRFTIQDKKEFVQNMIPNEEYDGYVTFLLHNASDIWDRQDTKYTLNPDEARDIWNETGNHVKQFYEKYIIRVVGSNVKAFDVRIAWDNFAIKKNIQKSLTSMEFYNMFEEVSGLEKMKVWKDQTMPWGYYGIRIKTEDEIRVEEQAHLESSQG